MEVEVEAVPIHISSPHTSIPIPPDIEEVRLPPSSAPPKMGVSIAKERDFWVSPPPLPLDRKREYNELRQDVLAELLTDDEDETLMKIVGEIRGGTDLYYFVEHKTGVVYKYLARELKNHHRALIDSYNEQKEQGTLPEFEPKSSRIHPKDRVYFATKTKSGLLGAGGNKRANPLGHPMQKSAIVESEDEKADSQTDYESEGAEEDFDDKAKDTENTELSTRRSVRLAASNIKSNYRDASGSPLNRRTKSKKSALWDDFHDSEEDFEESEVEEVKDQKKKTSASRGRFSRPAYGNVRHVADLSDDDIDDELAPLRAHRRTCEKCRDISAHQLLAKYYKRRTQQIRPKRKMDDSPGDEDGEEERLLALGGWIRCLKCCVVAHWKCLAVTQRDEIIKAARSKDKEAEAAGFVRRKKETLDAYDTTEFICGSCQRGGLCIFCLQTAVGADSPPEHKMDAPMEPLERVDAVELKNTDSFLSNVDVVKQIPRPAITVSVPSPHKVQSTVLDTSTEKHQASKSSSDSNTSPETPKIKENLFRCEKCKRPAHYAHLPQPISGEVLTSVDLARYYQTENEWMCPDCVSFVDDLDKILAWRPYPANAVEDTRPVGQVPNYKSHLPREYLVKWAEKSYRRLSWVPHMWLVSTNPAKLKNFISTGPRVHLLDTPNEDLVDINKNSLTVGDSAKVSTPSFLLTEENSRESSSQPGSGQVEGPSPPLPDAERRIPPAWKTVDRVLDIRLWNPTGRQRALQRKRTRTHRARKGMRNRHIEHESDSNLVNNVDPEAEAERLAARERGEMPTQDFLETIEEWEARMQDTLDVEHAEFVIWALVKWDDLPYEEVTWDSPPSPSDTGWEAFMHAFEQFLFARKVLVPKKSNKQAKSFDSRPKAFFERQNLALDKDPVLGQGENLKLMDFQLTGINWLFRNWWRHQPSILADDMGLGKTVQVSCLIGHLVGNFQVFPVLIVVPNSTITNWLRELARWAPRLRVVTFSGAADSRDIIRQYELYHESVPKDFTNLKFHVLVTTYETFIGKDFSSVFKPVPRWEMLIIDEGQRLKNDSSLLFKKLNELHSVHRILMTGTPLNNNIRELFNLMNFLDPVEWDDLDFLEKKYETLTEELLNELHETLKPYFLRRTKADVLKLPPKNEVIVPVSMTAIQKEVYKSILKQNVEILGTLAQDSGMNNTGKKSNVNNLLMQLRKCLQHPYLISRELEPTGAELTPSDVHRNLFEASAKLRLLHSMLPRLKARGHRVLLFSQFTIALDIIEDFIVGEGHKFLRLDGNTKQAQRQKDMDMFNHADSNIFIYLLSTRAGGVGVNLWSADTVIIFDPDFNPHQDLQAISRAHRYGQTKPVLVFKLMVKGAAEERIVQAGKKKLALDHLIVQKMDDEGGTDDLQSILTFGAKAIFEGSELQDINYTDADIDNLITRTEQEGDHVPESSKSQSLFGFAKLWVVEKDTMEELPEDVPADTQEDGFWSRVLARAAAEKAEAKQAEVTGRGAKRRAAVVQKQTYIFEDDGSPVKPKPRKRRKVTDDSDLEYHISDLDARSDVQSGTSTVDASLNADDEQLINTSMGLSDPPSTRTPKPDKPLQHENAVSAIENRTRDDGAEDDDQYCGLCHTSHDPGSCSMTQDPYNLMDYRSMLITESNEPIELRHRAVVAIDINLASRGLYHLVKDKPVSFAGDNEARPRRKKGRNARHIESNKRPAPPENPTSNKKAKQDTGAKCDICSGPYHQVKFCPIVMQGRESIMQVITRLEREEPQKTSTVKILKILYNNPTLRTV